jgi:hypothetical protein
VISETARLAKKRARQRAARERDKLVVEATDLLVGHLGDKLHAFCALFEQIDPHKLRGRLFEIIEAQPDPAENTLSIDEEKLAEMRRSYATRPRPAGGFVLDRVK